MAKDYIIAIGGTGARCLEAVIHLAAAGLFPNPMHVLMIDPDQSNGNSKRTGELLPLYHTLHACGQPSSAVQKRLLSGRELPEQVTFRTPINVNAQNPDELLPYSWQDPNKPERKFSQAIGFADLSGDFKDFARLFYDDDDLNMQLGKGYRGRPNIGSITLMADLRRTIGRRGNGLSELAEAVRTDLKSGAVRVFIFGSVFGGTGAAGLPTVPELLLELFGESGEGAKLRFGCAMMTPYFTFPKPDSSGGEGPAPDSAIHQVATQAALLHYAHVPPAYQHAYVVGAPELLDSRAGHQAGGEAQENDSHYAEVMAALAARDFFSKGDIDPAERQLHYAEGDHFGWKTLVSLGGDADDRARLKHRLLTFTTFAHLYHNVLHGDVKGGRWRERQAWYRDNFRGSLSLEKHGRELDALDEYLSAYLKWLNMVGQPIRDDPQRPFEWSAVSTGGDAAAADVGKLSRPESGEQPKYAGAGYGRVMERLGALVPAYNNKAHPVGLLIYLLYEACSEFVADNYRLGRRAEA